MIYMVLIINEVGFEISLEVVIYNRIPELLILSSHSQWTHINNGTSDYSEVEIRRLCSYLGKTSAFKVFAMNWVDGWPSDVHLSGFQFNYLNWMDELRISVRSTS